jgi:hypothetical protein
MIKKPHASELDARERIARAQSFSVYQYRHRNRYMRDGFATMAEAAAHAAIVEQEWPDRPTLLYAIVDGVSLPVPADLRAAASASSKG